MSTNLLEDMPQELVESADLEELMATVLAIPQWQNRHAQVLDYIYRHRLLRLVRTSGTGCAPLEDVDAFYDHLARVNHPRRREVLNALDRPYADRWRAYLDLLDTHIGALRSRAPERLLQQRSHVADILQLIKIGCATTQKDIQEILGLKEANTSRILKMMEAAELIVRHRVGRENRLVPGPSLQRLEDRTQRPSQVPRGIYFLSKVAA